MDVGSNQVRSSAMLPATLVVPARPVDRLRLVPTIEPDVAEGEPEVAAPSVRPQAAETAEAVPVAAAAVTAAAGAVTSEAPNFEKQGLVSIQTASLDELARLEPEQDKARRRNLRNLLRNELERRDKLQKKREDYGFKDNPDEEE